MKTLDFLTTINAVYNNADAAAYENGLNIFYNLLVYTNESGDILIKYNEIIISKGEDINTEKGEITLNNIGLIEFEFICDNLKKLTDEISRKYQKEGNIKKNKKKLNMS